MINLIAFITYGIDKWKARYHRWRIPEATLILLAVTGGALGAFIGMKVFRHKTQHWKFKILVPLLLVLWMVVIGYLI
ncbi:DUF1294 domain-containing protein [Phocaeicola oris]|uniref:DUF1294 domain-containing protein n=1 Tax=Phocaeicola oris TaxID=2896850 RepID=UPI00234E97F7|nr:DUF1294 domain-containing protein [Phocaeicola oris]MCE2615321.1 DUF1294 domain-containing protein [Phocaeicola oris]